MIVGKDGKNKELWDYYLKAQAAENEASLNELLGLKSRGDVLDRLNKSYVDGLKNSEHAVPIPDARKVPPELISRIDSACDPRSGGVGGFGTQGLEALANSARFSEKTIRAEIRKGAMNFVRAVDDRGTTSPQSVTCFSSAVFYSAALSLHNWGRERRIQYTIAQQARVSGWFKIDQSSGGGVGKKG